jgi:hypothetical protein
MIEQANLLLNQEWNEQEKILVKRSIQNLLYYKSFIPKAIKNDVIDILTIANSIKSEYTILKKTLNQKLTRRNSI